MRRLLLFIIATQLCLCAAASTKKADKLFENWEYAKAAVLYEKEVVKNPATDIYYRLGICYMKMNEYNKALLAFDHVDKAGQYSNPAFYLDYGLVLKNSGNYEEAMDVFKKYTTLAPKDKKGKFYLESCEIAVQDNKEDLPGITVTGVSALNTKYADIAPVPYKDGLVFTSSRGKKKRNKVDGWSGDYFFSLFFASKGAGDTSFGEAVPLQTAIDQKYHDGPACFTKGQDTIYFSRVEKDLRGSERRNLGIERIKIYTAVMSNGKWGHVKDFYLNNDSFLVACPFLSKDGKRLYFVSDMPGGYGGTDIWVCNLTRIGWGKPRNMGPKVNTFGKECYPYEDAEGNFYFSSDGYQGFGGLDICVAQNKNGALQKAKPLKEPLNSPGDDFGLVSMKGGKTGYFSSNREGGKGSDDIYYFDMGDDKSLVTKVYTIGYRPGADTEVPEVAKKTEEAPKPEEPKKVDLPLVKTTPKKPDFVLPNPPKPRVITTTTTQVVVDTRTKTDISEIAEGEKPEPPPPGNYPTFGLIAHFDRNKADIRPEDYKKLDSVAWWMLAHPDEILLIEGHTDTRANEQLNMALSKRRAIAAEDYLVSKGLDRAHIKSVGYGYRKLINFCGKGIECPDILQQVNRRVEFKLLKPYP